MVFFCPLKQVFWECSGNGIHTPPKRPEVTGCGGWQVGKGEGTHYMALALARDAATRLGATGLSGTCACKTSTDSIENQTLFTLYLNLLLADAEETWLHEALSDLRRLVPDCDRDPDRCQRRRRRELDGPSPSTAPPSTAAYRNQRGVKVGTAARGCDDAGGAGSASLARAEVAFMRLVTRARLDHTAAAPHPRPRRAPENPGNSVAARPSDPGPSSLSLLQPPRLPLPTLPLGARLVPMAELREMSTGSGCASDIPRLWADSRRHGGAGGAGGGGVGSAGGVWGGLRGSEGAAARRGGPGTLGETLGANRHGSGSGGDGDDADLHVARVVPLAVVGWLRLAPAASLHAAASGRDRTRDCAEQMAEATGLFLEDATGSMPCAVVGLPDARMLNQRQDPPVRMRLARLRFVPQSA